MISKGRLNFALIIGSLGGISLLCLALAAPVITSFSHTEQQLSNILDPASQAHWFGTDELGRDVWARCVFAVRTLFVVISWALFSSLLIGVPLGILAGRGGVLGKSIDVSTQLLLPFPESLLALLLASLLGPSLNNAMIVAAITATPTTIRVIRSEVKRLKGGAFVLYLHANGLHPLSIFLSHIFWHIMPVVLSQAIFQMNIVLVATTGLSFLGLGVSPPTPELGAILASSIKYAGQNIWVMALPAFLIILANISLLLLGDGIRKAFSLPQTDYVTNT
jgi:peptide/nickel transport system permease protein